MSYILEALKKSQQERSRGQVPDLQTLHAAAAVAATEQASPRWLYWALGLALLALAFLLGWLRPWSANDKPVTAVVEQVMEPVLIEADNARQKMPVSSMQAQPLAQPAVINNRPLPATQAEPVRAEAVEEIGSSDAVLDISELPTLLQQSIPQMQFAGHVYSSNPQQRSVIINGRAMSEGDELTAGMTLKQITPDSVIFDYQGRHFKVAVLHDWSFK